MPRFRSITRIATLVVASGCAAATLEIVLRQGYYHPLAIDPEFGYTFRPGSVVRWQLEGNGTSHWTVGGLRRLAPPDGTPPVLVLGDSFTEALMLDDHEVYTQRLEDALRASDRAMPVLNAGKSTMSVADYVFHAPYYRRTHHPRWTIIQLRDPDVTDDAWKSEPGVARFDRQDGTLVVRPPDVTPPSGLKRAIFEPRQRFSLLGFAITRLQKFALAAKQEPPLFRAGSEHKKAASPAVEYPIEDELAMLVQAFEGRVTFLYLPPYDPRGLEEPTQIEHRVAKACARAGWSFVNLRDRFPEFMAGSIAPYGFDNTSFNSGHLNRAGHAAAAKALQAEMERLLSLAVL